MKTEEFYKTTQTTELDWHFKPLMFSIGDENLSEEGYMASLEQARIFLIEEYIIIPKSGNPRLMMRGVARWRAFPPKPAECPPFRLLYDESPSDFPEIQEKCAKDFVEESIYEMYEMTRK